MLLSKPRSRSSRANPNPAPPRKIHVEFLSEDYLNEYNAFCDELVQEWQPASTAEERLVQTLADRKWRSDRANERKRAVYAKTLTGEPLDIAQVKILTELQQHGSRFQREYQNTLKMLQRLQADRKHRQELKDQQP